LRARGIHFDRYTAAVKQLDPPRLLESRPSYRLLDVASGQRRLKFGMAANFDKLDISEALGHEMANACMAHGEPPSTAAGYRSGISSATRSCLSAARSSRRSPRLRFGCGAILYRRRSCCIGATQPGSQQREGPTTSSQPASFSRHRWRSEIAALTLTFGATSFASTQRNCSARRSTTAPDPPPIDYDAWPLYRGLDQALTDGTLRRTYSGWVSMR
jgi:hypothetical protein